MVSIIKNIVGIKILIILLFSVATDLVESIIIPFWRYASMQKGTLQKDVTVRDFLITFNISFNDFSHIYHFFLTFIILYLLLQRSS